MKVAKAFNSVNRRFKVGDDVSAADIDHGSSMTFEQLVDSGHIAAEHVDAAANAGVAAVAEALAADHT